MSESNTKLPPEIAAQIALHESNRVRKLFAEIPKLPLYFIAALGFILAIIIPFIGQSTWAKPVVTNTIILLGSTLIGYLYVIVNKINALANHLQKSHEP